MTLPTLRYAGGRYDRTAALERGEIRVDGVELVYVAYANPGELFREMAQDAPYEASEMSLSTYLMLLAGGDRRLVGIPVSRRGRFATARSTSTARRGSSIRATWPAASSASPTIR